MKLTQKLIGYLSRVFDAGPQPVLVLRLRYDGAMSWQIAEGVLTTTVTGGSGAALTIDLAALKLPDLVAFLQAQPGYSVPYADLSGLSEVYGTVLIEGGASQDESNGDHLSAYTSALWAYLESQAGELKLLRAAVDQAVLQMSARTAAGEWVDEHGVYYDVPRRGDESDAAYAARIVAEVGQARGTNLAISQAIKSATGADAVSVDDVGEYTTAADGTKSFGLFDVTVVATVGGPLTPSEVDANARALVEAMRDAGTFLRGLRYVMRVRAGSYLGATMKAGSSVTVFGARSASFGAVPATGYAPLVVAFEDTTTGAPDQWLWSFGEGATSPARNPSHTYAAAGDYTVTLVASWTAYGASSTAVGSVHVEPPDTRLIAIDYSGAAFADVSSFGRAVSVVGSASIDGGWGYFYYGGLAAITVPDAAELRRGSSPWTFRTKAKLQDKDYNGIIGVKAIGTGYYDWLVFYNHLTDAFTLRAFNAAAALVCDIADTAGTKTTGQVYDVEASFDGATFRLFIDGALSASVTPSPSPGALFDSGGPVCIGGPSNGIVPFRGWLRDTRFHSACLHTASFTPP